MTVQGTPITCIVVDLLCSSVADVSMEHRSGCGDEPLLPLLLVLGLATGYSVWMVSVSVCVCVWGGGGGCTTCVGFKPELRERRFAMSKA